MHEEVSEQDAKLASLDKQIAEKRADLGEVNATIADIDATMPMVEAHFHIRAAGTKTGFGNELDYQDSLRTLVDQRQQRLIQLQKQRGGDAIARRADCAARRDGCRVPLRLARYTEPGAGPGCEIHPGHDLGRAGDRAADAACAGVRRGAAARRSLAWRGDPVRRSDHGHRAG